MRRKLSPRKIAFALAAVFATVLCAPFLFAESAESSSGQTPQPAAPAANTPATAPNAQASSLTAKPAATPMRSNQPARMSNRGAAYFDSVWGVEALSVKAVESGQILRFSYRVINPDLAKPLNDKKLEPALICPQKGLKLVIPSVDQVGMLRQTGTPEAGRSYWMAFSNSGRPIKRGDRVDVVIGNFRAEGLIVE